MLKKCENASKIRREFPNLCWGYGVLFGFFFHTISIISRVTFTKDIGLYSFNIFSREIVKGSFDFKSLKIRNIRKTFLEINEPISDRRYLFPGYLKLIVRHPVTFI
jgi:hypothetical protein